MGLCKCPKRQVTNQFCFTHRVNVCEFCMIKSHEKCIVQSYLQWLKDSDYDPTCTLCRTPLENEDCIRLICYHVFHWKCLNTRQQSLPVNTAPRGHSCPTCSQPIFPPANLVSPVGDVLRTRLGQVNWGRNELGLPLLSEEKKDFNKSISTTYTPVPDSQNGLKHTTNVGTPQNRNISISSNNAVAERSESPHSIVNIDSGYSDFHASTRRPLLQRESPLGSSDRDENKYRRRTPQEIFSRWSRRLYAPASRPPWRRTWFLVLSGILGFIFLIYLMAVFGRNSADHESMLDIGNEKFLRHEIEA